MFNRKLLLLALACPAPAIADTLPTAGSDEIRAAAHILSLYSNELDCENVGYIQTGEEDEHFAPIFRSLDMDRSKSISRKELMTSPHIKNQSLLDVTFTRMDSNSDGVATPDELLDYLSEAISSIDGNADGDVYPSEYEHALKTGTVLETAAPVTKSKPKQADIAQPWDRHQRALKLQAAKERLKKL